MYVSMWYLIFICVYKHSEGLALTRPYQQAMKQRRVG